MKGNDKAGRGEEVKPGSAPRWSIADPLRGSDKKVKKPADRLAGLLLGY
ncbi:hypothetical protein [Serratia silvae]|uniref:Uncharacterized protein n=1 Tax=Serratia silvae TaxID=2824122 RepID=A0ABT0K7Y2_9GAMM|nr:hypothetical protein [Serratia silvae]MCL1028140.1 hypothetical protein [Serratia silvae]